MKGKVVHSINGFGYHFSNFGHKMHSHTHITMSVFELLTDFFSVFTGGPTDKDKINEDVGKDENKCGLLTNSN